MLKSVSCHVCRCRSKVKKKVRNLFCFYFFCFRFIFSLGCFLKGVNQTWKKRQSNNRQKRPIILYTFCSYQSFKIFRSWLFSILTLKFYFYVFQLMKCLSFDRTEERERQRKKEKERFNWDEKIDFWFACIVDFVFFFSATENCWIVLKELRATIIIALDLRICNR